MNNKPIRHQAAGHDGTYTDEAELLVFKPTNDTEVKFYEDMQSRNAQQPRKEVGLQTWMPLFIGTLLEGLPADMQGNPLTSVPILDGKGPEKLAQGVKTGSGRPIVVLENLLHGYSRPIIIDIKLGRVLHDDLTDNEKRERLIAVSESTTSGSLGFRICGMKVQHKKQICDLEERYYEKDDQDYFTVNKHYGRDLTDLTVMGGLKLFFSSEDLSCERQVKLISIFRSRLTLLLDTLLKEEVRLISSSLFFVYEADSKRWDELKDEDTLLRSTMDAEEISDLSDDEDEAESMHPPTPLSSLSLIDFAHSRLAPNEGKDDNVIFGLERLIEQFDELLKGSNDIN
ncbi:LAMI_0H17920g1_1 [Lachancea mirantina]|uniref:Kinase n=1 Tax=Lachancea mirantina TaxID=1230905 RepID=A0A1G4KJJ6_9SACH|nr:LAMI_0H17920g1_1 [Lachancea mirantina]